MTDPNGSIPPDLPPELPPGLPARLPAELPSRSPARTPAPHDGAEPRPTLIRLVYQALRNDLISARLVPGARLRIQALSARYACGVIPLREALNRLTAEGWVHHSEQRGFLAAPVTADDAMDLCEARLLMSEAALTASINRGDSVWEERVIVAYHRVRKVPRYESTEPPMGNPHFDEPHRAFHMALVSACGSQRMLAALEQMFLHAERYRAFARRIELSDPDADHRELMDAALDRDVGKAVALAREHILRPAQVVVEALRTLPITSNRSKG